MGVGVGNKGARCFRDEKPMLNGGWTERLNKEGKAKGERRESIARKKSSSLIAIRPATE